MQCSEKPDQLQIPLEHDGILQLRGKVEQCVTAIHLPPQPHRGRQDLKNTCVSRLPLWLSVRLRSGKQQKQLRAYSMTGNAVQEMPSTAIETVGQQS